MSWCGNEGILLLRGCILALVFPFLGNEFVEGTVVGYLVNVCCRVMHG